MIDKVGVVARPTGHEVGAGPTVQHIVTAPTDQPVSTRHSTQDIALFIALQNIVEGVAGRIVCIPFRRLEHQAVGHVLDIFQKNVLDVLEPGTRQIDVLVRQDGVDAFAGTFHENIEGIRKVQIVARAADQRIDPRAACQLIIAGRAGQHVVAGPSKQAVVVFIAIDQVALRVAMASDSTPGQHEVFHTALKFPVDGGNDRVGAAAMSLVGPVVFIANMVGVVPGTAGHVVGARPAVQHIGPAVADQFVVRFVSGGVEVAGAGQLDVFQLRALQCVAEPGHDGVVAAAGLLDDRVGAVGAEQVQVVAGQADQCVGARSADHPVSESRALQVVVTVAARDRDAQLLDQLLCVQHQQPAVVGDHGVLFDRVVGIDVAGVEALNAHLLAGDAVADHQAAAGEHHVAQRPAQLQPVDSEVVDDDLGARRVEHVKAVIAGAAIQQIIAVTAGQAVIAGAAQQGVIAAIAEQ